MVLFTGFLMFFIPASNRTVGRRILEWDMVIKQLPWDVLLLLGGGFALSEAFSTTHFTDYIAARLVGLSSFSPYLNDLASVLKFHLFLRKICGHHAAKCNSHFTH